MIDFQVAFDKLAQFETADELADFLLNEGIKAVPADANSCAISAWMKRTTEGEKIYTNTYSISEYSDSQEDAIHRASTTQPMIDFIVDFDMCRYPALIDASATLNKTSII